MLFLLDATGAPIVTGHRSAQDDIDGSTRRYRYGPVDGPPTIFWTATISTDRTFYQPEIRVIEVTEPDAARTAFAYDEGITGALRGLMAEPVTQVIDARGKPTETRMNRYGAATRVATPAGVTTTTWDLDHLQPETVLDALGGLTTFTYDTYGNTTSEVLVTLHGEKRRSWTYHPPAAFAAPHVTNRVATQTDPRGHVTELGYDPRGNLTTTSRGGVSTTNGYEANGDRRSLVDGNGKTCLFRYDAYGFPRETQSPLGHVTETAYDARGRKRAEVDATAIRPTGPMTCATVCVCSCTRPRPTAAFRWSASAAQPRPKRSGGTRRGQRSPVRSAGCDLPVGRDGQRHVRASGCRFRQVRFVDLQSKPRHWRSVRPPPPRPQRTRRQASKPCHAFWWTALSLCSVEFRYRVTQMPAERGN
jgi:YD repeat-containing protein